MELRRDRERIQIFHRELRESPTEKNRSEEKSPCLMSGRGSDGRLFLIVGNTQILELLAFEIQQFELSPVADKHGVLNLQIGGKF